MIFNVYTPSVKDEERVLNDFEYHAPFGNQAERYSAIRSILRSIAFDLMSMCPSSRELSIALTNLEQVGFYANAAIARNEKPEPETGV